MPKTVRIIPDSCYNYSESTEENPRPERTTLKDDALVFIMKPLPMLHIAALGKRLRENSTLAYAEIAVKQLVSIEGADGTPLLIGDEPFDAKNEDHVNALDPVLVVQAGDDLVGRAYLTNEELGK
jgi:hypothetical protein